MSNKDEVTKALEELQVRISEANTNDHDTMQEILFASDRLRAEIDLWYDKCWSQT